MAIFNSYDVSLPEGSNSVDGRPRVTGHWLQCHVDRPNLWIINIPRWKRYGDGSKPWYRAVNTKIAGIYGCEYPTKNVSIGIDPYPNEKH